MRGTIPYVAGAMQKARMQLTAAVFREKAERLDMILNFVRQKEANPAAELPVIH